MKKIITITFLLYNSFLIGQIFENDKEEFNIKGNVKAIYYEDLHFNHNPTLISSYSVIGHDYYFHFDKNGNIESYGKFRIDSITKKKVIINKWEYKKQSKNKKYSPNERLIESDFYYENGSYNGYLSSKIIYEYNPYRITQYNTSIDTTDIGYEYINFNPKEFSVKDHTKYNLYLDRVLLYNKLKKLVKIHFYDNVMQSDGNDSYDDSYDSIFEFEYDENGNPILRKELNRCGEVKRIDPYSYKFDKNNNWIQKTIICKDCVNEKDKIQAIINREIIYWKN